MKNITNLELLQAALFLTVFIGIYVGARQAWPDESLIAFVSITTVITVVVSLFNRKWMRAATAPKDFWSRPVSNKLTKGITGAVLALWAASVALIMGVLVIASYSVVVVAFAVLSLIAAAIYGRQLRQTLFKESRMAYGVTLLGALVVFLVLAVLVAPR